MIERWWVQLVAILLFYNDRACACSPVTELYNSVLDRDGETV